MNLRSLMTQKTHQRRDASKLPGLGLDIVIHVTKMLKVGSCIGLDDRVGVLKEFYHFVKIWISPLYTRHGRYT